MIKATSRDIGRVVVYKSFEGAVPEKGTITSVNKDFVFVRYNSSKHSQATLRRDLDWLDDK
jgi:hypothetical protein